ncbi:MAG: DUF4199 domain-containing protein [Saprospiraceae bacterium]|nr:DUF4199 domain-containing protein [Saprospiraceae bacterium]
MDLENPAIKNGVYAGLAACGILLLFYLVKDRMVFTWASWVSTIIFIYFMVMSVRSEKAALEHMSFNDALKPAFLTFVVSNLLYITFYYVLLNFIAPDLVEMQRKIAMETMEKMGNLMGEDAMEEGIEALENHDFSFGLKTAALSFAWGLIFPGFIVSAIIALVMKDRKPEAS